MLTPCDHAIERCAERGIDLENLLEILHSGGFMSLGSSYRYANDHNAVLVYDLLQQVPLIAVIRRECILVTAYRVRVHDIVRYKITDKQIKSVRDTAVYMALKEEE